MAVPNSRVRRVDDGTVVDARLARARQAVGRGTTAASSRSRPSSRGSSRARDGRRRGRDDRSIDSVPTVSCARAFGRRRRRRRARARSTCVDDDARALPRVVNRRARGRRGRGRRERGGWVTVRLARRRRVVDARRRTRGRRMTATTAMGSNSASSVVLVVTASTRDARPGARVGR